MPFSVSVETVTASVCTLLPSLLKHYTIQRPNCTNRKVRPISPGFTKIENYTVKVYHPCLLRSSRRDSSTQGGKKYFNKLYHIKNASLADSTTGINKKSNTLNVDRSRLQLVQVFEVGLLTKQNFTTYVPASVFSWYLSNSLHLDWKPPRTAAHQTFWRKVAKLKPSVSLHFSSLTTAPELSKAYQAFPLCT